MQNILDQLHAIKDHAMVVFDEIAPKYISQRTPTHALETEIQRAILEELRIAFMELDE